MPSPPTPPPAATAAASGAVPEHDDVLLRRQILAPGRIQTATHTPCPSPLRLPFAVRSRADSQDHAENGSAALTRPLLPPEEGGGCLLPSPEATNY